jgi:hypothetical protein
MESLSFNFDIPVRYQCDICVVGAGPGGIAAAVTAARRGHKVMLFEAHTMSGGMSTAGLVPVFMPFSDGINFLPDGFGREIIYGLSPDGHFLIPAEKLKFLYEKLLLEAGVEVFYYCKLIKVRKENGRVSHTFFAGPGDLFAVQASCFIDGTGDGTLAVLAGCDYDIGDEQTGDLMPATLCSLWQGIDGEKYLHGGAFSHNDKNMLRLLEAAFASGELSLEDYHHTGFSLYGDGTGGANISHVFQINSANERSLTNGILENRRLLQEYEAFYRKHIPGFEQAKIIATASLLGVRESRRIKGVYTLNKDDYEARRTFPDEIGRYNFPADIHPSRAGRKELQEHKKLFSSSAYKKGESYGIPYRILLPAGQMNLLLCGRCVSSDRHVFSSLRCIPGCYITGQASGMAAALSVEKNVSPNDLDTDFLRKELRKIHAFFK